MTEQERAAPAAGARARTGSVQSLSRAFDLLELLADMGGSQALSQLAAASGLPLPTIHRLMRTLADLGYVRQEKSRRYALGPRLIRLGEMASRMLGTWARPHLATLVQATGETANLALLDGDEVTYVAQVPGRHSMRMFTEPGRRVLPHSTAVGKAMLAQLPAREARGILDRSGMPAATPATITDPDVLIGQLEVIRRQGYSVDEGEQEVGVRCFAVAVPDAPATAALSVSGPQARLGNDAASRVIPVLHEAATALSRDLTAAHDPDSAGRHGGRSRQERNGA